jgi:hypothetical protein
MRIWAIQDKKNRIGRRIGKEDSENGTHGGNICGRASKEEGFVHHSRIYIPRRAPLSEIGGVLLYLFVFAFMLGL